MPTNEERREVAARLRKARANLENIPMPRGINQASFIYLNELAKALGNDGHIFTHLADLIEPEPERTCRSLSKVDDVFVCSECQNETHGCMVDKFGFTVGFGKVVSFCPNCGAKVVE